MNIEMTDSLFTDTLQVVPVGPLDSLGVDVTIVDSLPSILTGGFVTCAPLPLTRYYSARDFAPGYEGAALPYSPRTDNFIAFILLLCFFVSSFALMRSKKFLLQQAKDFMLRRERASIFASSTAVDVRFLLLLALQTGVLGGICIFNYFIDVSPALMNRVSLPLLLIIYICICLLYLLFKWMIYSFLGWTFLDRNRMNLWLESYYTLLYYLGFVLFLFVLFAVYFDLTIFFLISIGAIIAVFTKLLMFYKWIKLFFSHIGGLFLLILYFCALEIVPCLIAYRVLIELNNILVLKI